MRNLLKSKKGQLGNLQAIVMTLIVIGILLGVGFLILQEFKGTLDDNTATVNNETVTALSDAGNYVKYNSTTADVNCYNTFVVTRITNKTKPEVWAPGNYTYSTDTGKITLVSLTSYNATDGNVTYTYNYGKDACGGVEATVTATQKIPTWLPIIAILFMVGILLAIVFKVTGGFGAGGEGKGFGGFRRRSGEVAEV